MLCILYRKSHLPGLATLCPFGTLTGTWLPRDHPIWRSGWVASLQPWPTEPIQAIVRPPGGRTYPKDV